MNVFEDLIVELKEENLLEKTVIEVGDQAMPDVVDFEDETSSRHSGSAMESVVDLQPLGENGSTAPAHRTDGESAGKPLAKPRNGIEYYRKRAVNEVSNLQMVEHVLTGVEREFMKIVPNAFDDFKAKKALHTFLNVDENENSDAHTESEFTLMHETQAWCGALAERDQKVPVSSLRQFCENSRPALSSQALLGLARFYRNLPYSEHVRAKFDFVITRLFSKAVGDEKREALFRRDEAISHINNLYHEWSSIALYSAEDDEAKLLLMVQSFEDLATEAENASHFDQLIESDFFGRLKLFKESISELFYAPMVVAAAVEGNIRIGKAYFQLLERENEKMNAESIQLKYGELNVQAISDAAARTLALVETLKVEAAVPVPVQRTPTPQRPAAPVLDAVEKIETTPPPAKSKTDLSKLPSPFFRNFAESARSINRGFLAIAMVLIAASIGIYIWSNFFVTEEISTADVKTVNVENSAVSEHVRRARISGETYYATMLPSWDGLPKEKREEFLRRVLQSAQENGCKQVSISKHDGKNAGYASATRLEVVMP